MRYKKVLIRFFFLVFFIHMKKKLIFKMAIYKYNNRYEHTGNYDCQA